MRRRRRRQTSERSLGVSIHQSVKSVTLFDWVVVDQDDEFVWWIRVVPNWNGFPVVVTRRNSYRMEFSKCKTNCRREPLRSGFWLTGLAIKWGRLFHPTRLSTVRTRRARPSDLALSSTHWLNWALDDDRNCCNSYIYPMELVDCLWSDWGSRRIE